MAPPRTAIPTQKLKWPARGQYDTKRNYKRVREKLPWREVAAFRLGCTACGTTARPYRKLSRMIKAHKIRLHPTPEQANYFARAAGTARFVFNWALAEWKRQYEAGEKSSALALKKQFNAIRREQFPWSYEVTKCAIEGAFMDVGTAFKNFFEAPGDEPGTTNRVR